MDGVDMTIISEKELWTKKPFKKKIGDENHWARIKVNFDKRSNKNFFDVLIGKRFEGENRERRVHYGITLNQEILFANPREIGICLKREVNSKLKGDLAKDEIKFDNQLLDMIKEVLISFKIEGETGEVYVDKFEFKQT